MVAQLLMMPAGLHARTAISQPIAESENIVVPTVGIPTPGEVGTDFRVYKSGNKVVMRSDAPVAGIQLETEGQWDISQNLLPSGWSMQKRNGRMLIYSLSDRVLDGKVNLFQFSGDLVIKKVIAGDRQGRDITQSENRNSANISTYETFVFTQDKIDYYKNYFANLSAASGMTTSTVIKADNISAGPGDTGLLFQITMDNIASNAAGTQFTLTDLPDWVYVSSSVAQVPGFNSYVNDNGDTAEILVVNLEGGILPTGVDIPLVNLYVDIDPLAVLSQPIDMSIANLVVSDVFGSEVQSTSVSGSITLGTKGDVNFDGNIDILDIILSINFSIGLSVPSANELWAADMNQDSIINILDVVRIINATLTQGEGMLSVALTLDTPESGIVPSFAARHPFTKIALTAGSDNVTIDSFVLQRGGAGQDGAFSSVAILDGETMTPYDLSAQALNGSNQATFTQDLLIPANTTKYIYLAGNMGYLGSYVGEIPTLGLTAINLSGQGQVIGALPIYGNPQTLNATISIGSSTISIGSYNQATSTIPLGTNDFVFLGFRVMAGSVEANNFDDIVIYQEGTATLGTEIGNFELFRDTTKIADGIVSGNYIIFRNLNQVVPIGNIYQYQVKADILGGSGRSVDLGIFSSHHVVVSGGTYGYGIAPTFSGVGSSPFNPRLSGNMFIITGGTMSVARGESVAAGNITIGNNQILGAFRFSVVGEPIDVSQISLTMVSSSASNIEDALQSVRIIDSNGSTVAGPVDITNNTSRATLTDLFTVPVGLSEYRVVANLSTNGGWQNNSTVFVRLATPASSILATGALSHNNIFVSPASNVDTHAQTIKTANLTVTRNTLPSNGYVVAGAQDVRLGAWTFDASDSGEDIRVTSLSFAASSSAATNLTVYDGVYGSGGVALTPVNPAPASTTDGATSTFALDNPIIVVKGTSKIIELIGDIENTASTGSSSQFGLTDSTISNNTSVVAYGMTTANRASLNLVSDDGAILTYVASGAVAVSTYNNPANSFVRAGATGVTMGHVRFEAQYEDLDLDQLVLYVADGGITGSTTGNYQDIVTAYIYNGATLLASNAIPATGKYTFNFSNGTLVVPADSSVVLTIKADFGAINQNFDNAPATPAADVRLGFGGTDGFKFTGQASALTAAESYAGSTSSAKLLHKALPTVTSSTAGSPLGAVTNLINGASNLFAFNTTADAAGSEVLLYRSSFELSTGGGQDTRITNCYLHDGIGNVVGPSTTPTITAGGKAVVSYVFNNPSIFAGDIKEALQVNPGSSQTYLLNCTVTNAGTGDYLSVSLLGDTASSTPAASHGTPSTQGQNIADAWGAYNQGNFVWSDNYKNRGLATDGANATTWGQWYNGYLVSGLGINTTGTAYTITW